MPYRRLFTFVEGNDDERFFNKIVVPVLKEKFDDVRLVQYAQMKKERIRSYIRSIVSAGWDYVYVTDMDDSPCVTAKKRQVQNEFPEIDPQRIAIVIREIESWYLAGLSLNKARELKLGKLPKNTDGVTKEHLSSMIPRNSSRVNFMIGLLDNFSLETAKRRNKSFKYFFEKILSLKKITED
ncbi:MAG TPA: hypothetical protein DHV12_06115 [Thermotogae bacterium]|nr:hypothetical protein [Thermotogota bacterium]